MLIFVINENSGEKIKSIVSLISISSLGCLFLVNSSYGSIQGDWSCTYRITSSTTNLATGIKLPKQKQILDRQLTFFDDGSYQETAAGQPVVGEGVWVQRGRKAIFRQNPKNIANNSVYGCSLVGRTCSVFSAFAQASGKESRDGFTYKGDYAGRLSWLVNGVLLSTKIKGTFRCSR